MIINRVWSMPNSNTFSIKPIGELINKYISMLPIGRTIVDPFANSNKFGTITNDLDTQYDTDYHMDATDFLSMLDDGVADMVLWDPPIQSPTGIGVLQATWTNSQYGNNSGKLLVKSEKTDRKNR